MAINPFDFLPLGPQEDETSSEVVPAADSAGQETLADAFTGNSIRALREARRILDAPLPTPFQDGYGEMLRAKTAVSTAQISAQLKLDEQRLRQAVVEGNLYDELRRRMNEFSRRSGLPELFEDPPQ